MRFQFKQVMGFGASVVVAVAAFACGGGSSGSGGSSNSCLAQSAPSDTCASCDESHCGSQVSNIESACSAFLSCLCPNGTYTPANAETCASKIDSACSTADSALNACQSQSCASSCSGSSSGSSGGGSGSGSGSGSGGGGGADVAFSCTISTECIQSYVPQAAVSGLTSECTGASMGTAGGACPAASLTGCCASSTTPHAGICYYGEDSAAASLQSACTMQSGHTWQTTPLGD